jgi:DNA processing protein
MRAASDHESWIALSLVPEVGDQTLRKLLREFGTPAAVLAASRAKLEGVVARRVADNVLAGAPRERIDATLCWLERDEHDLLTLGDPDYPLPLLEISDPPALLYLAGRRELLLANSLAIVGSRNPSPQGIDNAEAFARALSDAGITIVSGLAEGIDAASHRGGLVGRASTIAVVGTGLDRDYPACNKDLAQKILKHGVLLSEFPLGMRALPGNFPRRNRIISGLAKGCLVVEAAVQSGSLITARCALEQGREVFAVPGSVHSPLSKGCHALIKQGATLVESATDVLEELGGATVPSATSTTLAHAKYSSTSGLLAHVGYDPVDLDVLCSRSRLPPEEVMAGLLELELAGRIAALPGGLYQRRN